MTAPEMPETIWARPEHTDAPAYGPWWQTYQDEDMVAQYTRADLFQAAIAAAMNGVMKPLEWQAEVGMAGELFYEAQCHVLGMKYVALSSYDKIAMDQSRAARILSALSIHTDATAALEAMLAEAKKRGRDQALEDAACVLEHALDAAGNTVTANTMRLVYAELGASIRDMKGGK